MLKYGYKGLTKVKRTVDSNGFKEKWRKAIKDFTRKRKMDFVKLIHYILNKRGLSTNMEINNFFYKIDEDTDMTAQALLDQRLKLKAEAFVELNEVYLKGFYSEYRDKGVKDYKGYILKAIDGTDFEIPNTERSKDAFGRVKGKKEESIPRASVSMCYDVLNGYIIDVIPEKSRTKEKDIAKRHIIKDQQITENDNSIYIMDRNYMSMDFLTFLLKNNIKFLIRLNIRYFKQETEKMKTKDEIIEIAHTKERMRKDNFTDEETMKYAQENKLEVRVGKHALKTGEEEYLITNLKEFSYEEIFEIYGKRWNIETLYDSLKNKLQIEKFTSSKEEIIKQDIYASTLVYNMVQTMRNEAQEKIDQKKYKHEMKVNENISIGLFKNEMIHILLEDNDSLRSRRYDELCKKLLKYRIPIRKDREYKIQWRPDNQNSYNKLKSF